MVCGCVPWLVVSLRIRHGSGARGHARRDAASRHGTSAIAEPLAVYFRLFAAGQFLRQANYIFLVLPIQLGKRLDQGKECAALVFG